MNNKGLPIGSPFVLRMKLNERFPTRSFFTLGNDAIWIALNKKRRNNLILHRNSSASFQQAQARLGI